MKLENKSNCLFGNITRNVSAANKPLALKKALRKLNPTAQLLKIQLNIMFLLNILLKLFYFLVYIRQFDCIYDFSRCFSRKNTLTFMTVTPFYSIPSTH